MTFESLKMVSEPRHYNGTRVTYFPPNCISDADVVAFDGTLRLCDGTVLRAIADMGDVGVNRGDRLEISYTDGGFECQRFRWPVAALFEEIRQGIWEVDGSVVDYERLAFADVARRIKPEHLRDIMTHSTSECCRLGDHNLHLLRPDHLKLVARKMYPYSWEHQNGKSSRFLTVEPPRRISEPEFSGYKAEPFQLIREGEGQILESIELPLDSKGSAECFATAGHGVLASGIEFVKICGVVRHGELFFRVAHTVAAPVVDFARFTAETYYLLDNLQVQNA